MQKRLTQLSFIIGLFFTIVSIILFVNMVVNDAFSGLNLYTTIAFFVFGLAMIFARVKQEPS